MIPYVISGNTISAFIGGDLKTLDASHPNFEEIRRRLRSGDVDDIDDLFDITAALKRTALYEDELITVGFDTLLYNGTPVHSYLARKIIEMVRNKQPATPWINFLKRLQHNPDPTIKDYLFDWLDASGMPITPDGYFLAYKKVQNDYLSYHDGQTLNTVGSTIFLPREECDPDRYNTCSRGLHFCSWGYLPNYRGNEGRVVVLKVNPADVTAFPKDHEAKGRACRYTIVDEVPEDEARHAFPEPVYATFYDEWEDEEPESLGLFGRIKAWTKRLLN